MFNKFSKILLVVILLISNLGILSVNADDLIWGLGDGTVVPGANIINPITAGMNEVKDNLGNETVTEGGASDYIQKVVAYFLTFITLIATIYVIYAGFRILTSSGEDETIKNSKKTIIYVIIGIVIIRFAYEIAYFAVNVGEEAKKIN